MARSLVGGGPGAPLRGGKPLPRYRRRNHGKAGSKPPRGLAGRPAVTCTVARRRRSVKEPEQARSSQKPSDPSRRSGSDDQTRALATLAHRTRWPLLSGLEAPRKATLTAAGRRRPELPQGREHSELDLRALARVHLPGPALNERSASAVTPGSRRRRTANPGG